MNWLTRLVFGSLTIGAPSLVALGGFVDGKERVFSQASGINRGLKKAGEEGGGNIHEGLAEIKKEVLDSADGKHPGVKLYSITEYIREVYEMERIKNKNKDQGDEESGDKGRLMEKVVFDKSSGGEKRKLVIKTKDIDQKEKFLDDRVGRICVFSVVHEDIQGGKDKTRLDLIIGFAENDGKPGSEVIGGGTNGLLDKDGTNWCNRRASQFEKDRDLLVGITLKVGDSKQKRYEAEKNAYGYVGREIKNDGGNRIYAEGEYKNGQGKAKGPVVLGIVRGMKVKERKFETQAEQSDWEKLYCGKEECWQGSGRGKNRPVGVRFENVKITGRSLSDGSTNP